jgi:hypothetical protein
MIKGTTIVKREIVDAPRSKVRIGTIPAGVEIIATEHDRQWLHLSDGGWVNAGAKQQYIQWRILSASDVESEPVEEDPEPELDILIKGVTIVERKIVNFPRGEVAIGTIPAGVEIAATEHIHHWLHLIDGGWVNAGAKQQYIQWQIVPDPEEEDPGPVLSSQIMEIKRKGWIATLRVDWQNPKWNFEPRQAYLKGAYPQTVTFNAVRNHRKGSRIPLKRPVLEYLKRLNGEQVTKKIIKPQAGWINRPTTPPSIERLTWAGNHVIVTETAVEGRVDYSNIYALSCHEKNLGGTFFDKDMRLVLHKFNAITWKRIMIKLADGVDCYTPFITDPNVNNGGMWIRSDYLEMWPKLPYSLSDGSKIVEYELHGFEILGLREDGSSVVLRDPSGFKTSWRINSPEVPY